MRHDSGKPMPCDTILANRRRESRCLSSRRRHKKSKLGKTSIGMLYHTTLETRRWMSWLLLFRRRHKFPNEAKMRLGMPCDTILADRCRASRRVSLRHWKKSNVTKTCIGMLSDTTLAKQRPASRRLSSGQQQKIPNKGKMGLGTPEGTISSNRRETSQHLSRRRRQ
jgi:hypothetical protein